MRSFQEAVVEVLRREGPTEILELVQAALTLRPARNRNPWAHVEKVCRMVNSGLSGLYLAQQPMFRLAASLERLPDGRRLRAVLIALNKAGKPLSLSALAGAYTETYKSAAICPEFWVLTLLTREEGVRYVKRRGQMIVGLRDKSRSPARPRRDSSIAGGIDERSLETMLVGRLDLLEPGLTLIKRQFPIDGVGRIDLLCRDRRKHLVVVEIKRPAAGYREVVGQITTYMGWVRRNVAGPGQSVRGIIVVGRPDEKLRLAAEAVGILVRPFF